VAELCGIAREAHQRAGAPEGSSCPICGRAVEDHHSEDVLLRQHDADGNVVWEGFPPR
jgi:DNA repair exonuclease SbcCD ATPase subunit